MKGYRKIKMPTESDAVRCLDIRKRGKRGEAISRDDGNFAMTMFRQYPEWYSKTEARVFNETTPFGSNVSQEEEPLPKYSRE